MQLNCKPSSCYLNYVRTLNKYKSDNTYFEQAHKQMSKNIMDILKQNKHYLGVYK